jgi:hypothetical protein
MPGFFALKRANIRQYPRHFHHVFRVLVQPQTDDSLLSVWLQTGFSAIFQPIPRFVGMRADQFRQFVGLQTDTPGQIFVYL